MTASIHKNSDDTESTCVAEGAANAQPNTAAPGPIACPYPFPFGWHRTMAQIMAAEFAGAENEPRSHLPDGDGPARSEHPFHATLNSRETQRNHGA